MAVISDQLAEGLYADLHERDRASSSPDAILAHLRTLFAGETLHSSTVVVVEDGGQLVAVAAHFIQEAALTRRPEAVVYPLHLARPELSRQLLPQLLQPIEESARAAGCRWMYLEVPSGAVVLPALSEQDWAIDGFLVRHQLPLDAGSPGGALPTLALRPAGEDDVPFILACLADAIWNGLAPAERADLDYHACSIAAEALYAPVLRADRVALVAELDGTVCGHALVNMGVENRYTGEREAELVDTYVLPSYRRQGVAQALTAEAAKHACLQGARHLVGNVGTADEAGDKIFQALLRTGWWPHVALLRKAVPNPTDLSESGSA